MKHLTDDQLLAHVLETISDNAEHVAIAHHLEACMECRTRLERCRSEVALISGVRPSSREVTMPHPARRPSAFSRAVRIAAVFIVGVAIGVLVRDWTTDNPARVSPAYVKLTPPSDSLAGWAASDATGLPASFYRDLLAEPK